MNDEETAISHKYIEKGPHGETILKVWRSLKVSHYWNQIIQVCRTHEAIGKVVHLIFSTSSAIKSSLERQNELKLIRNFNKIYLGFKDDLQNIVKRRKLERSNQHLGLESDDFNASKTDEKLDQNVSKLMSFGGAENLFLENILGGI